MKRIYTQTLILSVLPLVLALVVLLAYNRSLVADNQLRWLGPEKGALHMATGAVLNAVWEIPVGKGRRFLSQSNSVVNGVLGGWQLYWIGYMETGHFFSPSYSGSDPSNTNTVGGQPDRLCNGNLPSDQRRIDRWFDAACFAPPPSGRDDSLPRRRGSPHCK